MGQREDAVLDRDLLGHPHSLTTMSSRDGRAPNSPGIPLFLCTLGPEQGLVAHITALLEEVHTKQTRHETHFFHAL